MQRVVFNLLLFQKSCKIKQEGFANLTTDSDYNYLAKHVNANRFPFSAVTYCCEGIFSTSPKFVISSRKCFRRGTFPARTTIFRPFCRPRQTPSLPLLSATSAEKLPAFF